MQVVCTQCKLNFNAADDAAGLTCPICRSPLRPAHAAQEAPATGSKSRVLEWDGGTVDELIEMLNSAALAVVVEVIPEGGSASAGEVHLLAGGVSEARAGDKTDDDALEALRAVTPARFRVEPRLPNPASGELTYPGPDAGRLDERPLAKLMRYCEDYVLTCAIEVWRGNEHARVEYRKGEITGITVGGIDAPERLSEVIKWSSGNYRLVVPRLTLPEAAPRPAVAPAPARVAAAPAHQAAAEPAGVVPEAPRAVAKTMFGVGPEQVAAMAAAAASARAASKQAEAQPAPPAKTPETAAAAPAAPPVAIDQGGVPIEPSTAGKTLFGMPAPKVSDTAIAEAARLEAERQAEAIRKAEAEALQKAEAAKQEAARLEAERQAEAARKAEAERAAATQKAEKPAAKAEKARGGKRKQEPARPTREAPYPPATELEPPSEDRQERRGARTQIGLPLEAMGIIPPQTQTQAAPPAKPTKTQPSQVVELDEQQARHTKAGHEAVAGRRSGPQVVLTRTAVRPAEKARVQKPGPRRKELPLWMYVGLGFSFGLVLMGVYWAMGVLAR